jgi:hypothetical protein
MKGHLEALTSTVRSGYCLNYRVEGAFGLVVLSMSSVQAANDVIMKVATFPKHGESSMSARPATPAEIERLWAASRTQLAAAEQASKAAVARYDSTSPGTQRALWHAASDAVKAVDERLEQLDPANPSTPSEKLNLLKQKLEARQQQEAAKGALIAMHQPLEGPLETYSSSTANVTHPGQLFFVSRLPEKMCDGKFLAFLAPLELELLHVWRDPNVSTTLCCELPHVGAVFALLRIVDSSDFVFNGALISKSKPSPV